MGNLKYFLFPYFLIKAQLLQNDPPISNTKDTTTAKKLSGQFHLVDSDKVITNINSNYYNQ